MIISYFMLIEVLRQAVPGLYLLMCLYIGLVGYRSIMSWFYLFIFGMFGISSYMLLNEGVGMWIPVWITNDHWFFAAMIGILMMGIVLFTVAIESQDLDWPWELVEKMSDQLYESRKR